MLEVWTGEVIGTMHIHKILKKELAEKMGVTDRWLSALLNGKRSARNAEFKTRKALDELIREKEAEPLA